MLLKVVIYSSLQSPSTAMCKPTVANLYVWDSFGDVMMTFWNVHGPLTDRGQNDAEEKRNEDLPTPKWQELNGGRIQTVQLLNVSRTSIRSHQQTENETNYRFRVSVQIRCFGLLRGCNRQYQTYNYSHCNCTVVACEVIKQGCL